MDRKGNYIVTLENLTFQAEVKDKYLPGWEAKDIAYYTTQRESYHNNSLASTKSFLNLSAAGIGLLVTLGNVLSSITPIQLAFLIIAGVAFLCTIFIARQTLDMNAQLIDLHIVNFIHEKKGNKDYIEEEKVSRLEKYLCRLDYWVEKTFFAAIISTVIFSSLCTWNKFVKPHIPERKECNNVQRQEKRILPEKSSKKGSSQNSNTLR